jgi:hypothetical protein
MEAHDQPPMRATDVVLSVRMLEALRDEAIAYLGQSVPDARQGDDKQVLVMQAAMASLRRLDLDKVLGDLLAAPVPDEMAAFERAANLGAFNTTRKNDGSFLHPITQRAHAIWTAGVRWQQLQQLNNQAPQRRADDHNEGNSNV